MQSVYYTKNKESYFSRLETFTPSKLIIFEIFEVPRARGQNDKFVIVGVPWVQTSADLILFTF